MLRWVFKMLLFAAGNVAHSSHFRLSGFWSASAHYFMPLLSCVSVRGIISLRCSSDAGPGLSVVTPAPPHTKAPQGRLRQMILRVYYCTTDLTTRMGVVFSSLILPSSLFFNELLCFHCRTVHCHILSLLFPFAGLFAVFSVLSLRFDSFSILIRVSKKRFCFLFPIIFPPRFCLLPSFLLLFPPPPLFSRFLPDFISTLFSQFGTFFSCVCVCVFFHLSPVEVQRARQTFFLQPYCLLLLRLTHEAQKQPTPESRQPCRRRAYRCSPPKKTRPTAHNQGSEGSGRSGSGGGVIGRRAAIGVTHFGPNSFLFQDSLPLLGINHSNS